MKDKNISSAAEAGWQRIKEEFEKNQDSLLELNDQSLEEMREYHLKNEILSKRIFFLSIGISVINITSFIQLLSYLTDFTSELTLLFSGISAVLAIFLSALSSLRGTNRHAEKAEMFNRVKEKSLFNYNIFLARWYSEVEIENDLNDRLSIGAKLFAEHSEVLRDLRQEAAYAKIRLSSPTDATN